ncbi:MAG: hypothetical protein WDO69_01930 [Pseudomonadota bacterium]
MLRKSLIALAGVVSIVSACAKESDPPAAAPAPYAPPPAPAPTLAQPQPAVTAATPAPVATVPAAAAAPAGAMATPGAFALPCTSDASCGLARCNVQFQKCAFPCAGPVDCAAGASCNVPTGLCLPGAAPQ